MSVHNDHSRPDWQIVAETSGFKDLPPHVRNLIYQYSNHTLPLDKLPVDVLGLISAFAASSNVPQTSKVLRASFPQARMILWNEAKPQLRADPIIAYYIDAIDPALPGYEKFKHLYESMIAHVGAIPDHLRATSRYSVDFYRGLSQHMQDLSLERAWPGIEIELALIPDEEQPPILLTTPGKPTAGQIRTLLDDPLMLPLIEQISELRFDELQLLVIPKEIKLFTGLTLLSFQNNLIKILPPDFLQGFPALEAVNFAYNQIEVLPPHFLQGLTALQQVYFSYNQIRRVPPDFLQGLPNLETADFSDNPLEAKPA